MLLERSSTFFCHIYSIFLIKKSCCLFLSPSFSTATNPRLHENIVKKKVRKSPSFNHSSLITFFFVKSFGKMGRRGRCLFVAGRLSHFIPPLLFLVFVNPSQEGVVFFQSKGGGGGSTFFYNLRSNTHSSFGFEKHIVYQESNWDGNHFPKKKSLSFVFVRKKQEI